MQHPNRDTPLGGLFSLGLPAWIPVPLQSHKDVPQPGTHEEWHIDLSHRRTHRTNYDVCWWWKSKILSQLWQWGQYIFKHVGWLSSNGCSAYYSWHYIRSHNTHSIPLMWAGNIVVVKLWLIIVLLINAFVANYFLLKYSKQYCSALLQTIHPQMILGNMVHSLHLHICKHNVLKSLP